MFGDHSLYSHRLNAWTSSDDVERNFVFVTALKVLILPTSVNQKDTATRALFCLHRQGDFFKHCPVASSTLGDYFLLFCSCRVACARVAPRGGTPLDKLYMCRPVQYGF